MRSVYLRSEEAPRSPRIFKKRVGRVDDGIRAGEVVAVRTRDGRFVGRAFFNARSVIAARILDREEKGPPLDAAWFRRKLGEAAALRREVLCLEEVTDAYRVVHAEGDGLSGLVVDRYAEIAVVEVGSRGMFERLDDLEEILRDVLGVTDVVVRADPAVAKIEGFRVEDRRASPARTVVREYDLHFEVDCRAGHKTGFFVDQRESRREVGRLAAGRRVLDLCCYTGGFALAAARGGARSVTGVDLDEHVVEQARKNAQKNNLDVRFEHADVFDHLRRRPEADLVVLDPPKLAADRRGLPAGRRKSVDMNALALSAVAPGGLLFTFSCTGLFSPDDFEHHVREATGRAGRGARVLRVTGQPPDHPVDVHCPEGRYLTGLLLQVS